MEQQEPKAKSRGYKWSVTALLIDTRLLLPVIAVITVVVWATAGAIYTVTILGTLCVALIIKLITKEGKGLRSRCSKIKAS